MKSYRYDLHDNAVRIGGRELYYHGGKVVYEKSGSGPVLYLAGVNGRVEGSVSGPGAVKTHFIDGTGDVDGTYVAGGSSCAGEIVADSTGEVFMSEYLEIARADGSAFFVFDPPFLNFWMKCKEKLR